MKQLIQHTKKHDGYTSRVTFEERLDGIFQPYKLASVANKIKHLFGITIT